MHLAKDILYQGPIRDRMGHRGPVGAGDLAALQRLAPEGAHVFDGAGLVEAADLPLVAAVEHRLQQLPVLAPCSRCSLIVRAAATPSLASSERPSAVLKQVPTME